MTRRIGVRNAAAIAIVGAALATACGVASVPKVAATKPASTGASASASASSPAGSTSASTQGNAPAGAVGGVPAAAAPAVSAPSAPSGAVPAVPAAQAVPSVPAVPSAPGIPAVPVLTAGDVPDWRAVPTQIGSAELSAPCSMRLSLDGVLAKATSAFSKDTALGVARIDQVTVAYPSGGAAKAFGAVQNMTSECSSWSATVNGVTIGYTSSILPAFPSLGDASAAVSQADGTLGGVMPAAQVYVRKGDVVTAIIYHDPTGVLTNALNDVAAKAAAKLP